MKKGTVVINLSDLVDLQIKHEKLERMVAPYINELNSEKKNVAELEKLYEVNRKQIEDLNKRKYAESTFDWAKQHADLRGVFVTEITFNQAFDAMLADLISKAIDDLPF